MWKYLFARPPRSGVESPNADETRPFSSRSHSLAEWSESKTRRLPVWDEVKVMVSVGGMRLKHGGQLADIFNGTARILIERRS